MRPDLFLMYKSNEDQYLNISAEASFQREIPVLSSFLLRLIRDTGVFIAERTFSLCPSSAESERLCGRVADRPLAHVGAEREDGGAPGFFGAEFRQYGTP